MTDDSVEGPSPREPGQSREQSHSQARAGSYGRGGRDRRPEGPAASGRGGSRGGGRRDTGGGDRGRKPQGGRGERRDHGDRGDRGDVAGDRADARGAPPRRRGLEPAAPPVPESVRADELDREVRAELRGLSTVIGDLVARRLVMASRLLEEDPEAAYRHALAARRHAGRIGVVREAVGLAAYAAAHYAEAIAELRAARRMTGSDAYLPVMADCERGLGRPERALALARSADVARLDRAGQVEMRIVAAGARRDMGQLDAAVVTLQGPDLSMRAVHPWTARLRYAYADALLAAGRPDDALQWFQQAQAADRQQETDAADRIAELEGLRFVDLGEEEESDLTGRLSPPDADTGPASTGAGSQGPSTT